MGVQEILVILVVVVLLFGTPLLTFLLGYLVGRKRAHDGVRDEEPAQDPSQTKPVAPDEEPEDE